MTGTGSKILDGLRDAMAGNFAKVTIEGQTWVRADRVAELEHAIENHHENIYLISVVAKIREATGVGAKPMLSELPEAVAAEIAKLKAIIAGQRERLRPDMRELLLFEAAEAGYKAELERL